MSQEGAGAGAGAGAAAAAGDRRVEPQTLAITPLISAQRKEARHASNNSGNGFVLPPPVPLSPYPMNSPNRLRLNPNNEHKPDNYNDLELDFSPLLFSSLEKYLPPTLLGSSRDTKVQYVRELLLRYTPDGERNRVSNWLS